MRTKHGNNITVHYSVDASLIGGIRLQVGETLIDGSVSVT